MAVVSYRACGRSYGGFTSNITQDLPTRVALPREKPSPVSKGLHLHLGLAC
jgi:hypothetical protein